MSENLHNGRTIRTVTGVYIDVFNPKPEDIRIEDIAHSLSHQCRFGGHLKEFYSVAQHSSICCGLQKELNLGLATILHDASEAYLLDIPKPIKRELKDYQKVEDNLMRVIADKFGFEYPLNPSIKKIDKEVLEVEWKVFVLGEQTDTVLKALPPTVAKAQFMEMWKIVSWSGSS